MFSRTRFLYLFGAVFAFSTLTFAAANDAAGDSVKGNSYVETSSSESNSFEWKAALGDAAFFLGIEHTIRLTYDPNVRRSLRGPFFGDYAASLENIHGWGDGDGWVTNYVGHPMSGSITGFIEAHHDPRYRNLTFEMTGSYWKSRARAMAFSAAYSLQFEIGPVSEASLGNTQLNPRARGVVDWVVTPTIGTAWMVTEDLVDKYVIRSLEQKTGNRALLILTRSVMNPTRTAANVFGRRRPWQRDDRPGIDFLVEARRNRE
jgi:hypothetical protein